MSIQWRALLPCFCGSTKDYAVNLQTLHAGSYDLGDALIMSNVVIRTATAAFVAVVSTLAVADVPQAPRLLDSGAVAAPEPNGTLPDANNEDSVLRDYLRGNELHGWQEGQMGKPSEFWNQKVNSLPVNSNSSAVTEYLGYVSRGNKSDPSSEFFAQFDMGKDDLSEPYSHNVLTADSETPLYEFTPRLKSLGFPHDDFFTPHCDRIKMPVPVGGRLQNETDYRCTTDGDCHLYVVNSDTGMIYEQWRAFNPGPDPSSYSGGCANFWDLSVEQEPDLRGLSCSSANAAGIPYVPLLVTPGEIKAGVIRHALAFTMPNGWVQRDVYARPATHNPLRSPGWGEPDAGPGTPMMYGSRFRLRGNFVIDPAWPKGLRVILQALKDYGMIHIDGGPRMLITSNDSLSDHSWTDPDINLNPFDLTGIGGVTWSDLELVSDEQKVGSMKDASCSRVPVNEF